jgi:hypothetical protein
MAVAQYKNTPKKNTHKGWNFSNDDVTEWAVGTARMIDWPMPFPLTLSELVP